MTNPYPGLRPFRSDEASLYFGRETIAETVAMRLRLSALTVLFARSGVGKSSFLTCRLLPALLASGSVAYLNEWGAARPEELIRRSLDRATPEGTERPVLVLDQFEDVFKQPGSRDDLWDELAGLVNVGDPAVSVLVSMREEWLGAWEEATDYLPDALASLVRLAPLTDGELTRAIRRPAEVDGSVRVGADLAPALLADLRRPSAYGLGGAYVEPGLLQLVCRRLWEEAAGTPDRLMDAALYERLGRSLRPVREFVWRDLSQPGKAGALSATERVVWVGLTRQLTLAHGVKASVSTRDVARQLQLRDLGSAGPAIAAATLSRKARRYLRASLEDRAEPPEDLTALIGRVLEKGAGAGLLKRQRGAGLDASPTRRYELAHDTLGELLGQFAIDFERWMHDRIVRLTIGLAAALLVAPALAMVWLRLGHPPSPIRFLGFLVVVALVWMVLFGIVRLLLGVAVRVAVYPLVRILAGGRVPLPADKEPW